MGGCFANPFLRPGTRRMSRHLMDIPPQKDWLMTRWTLRHLLPLGLRLLGFCCHLVLYTWGMLFGVLLFFYPQRDLRSDDVWSLMLFVGFWVCTGLMLARILRR